MTSGVPRSVIYVLSGLSLPMGVSIPLPGGGLVGINARSSTIKPSDDPAEVRPPGRGDSNSRSYSRLVLASELPPNTDSDVPRLNSVVERMVLPLRVGTPGTIRVAFSNLVIGDLKSALEEGSDHAPPERLHESVNAEMDEEDVGLMQNLMGQLLYRREYDAALSAFSNAYYAPSMVDMGVQMVNAIDMLFDPFGNRAGQVVNLTRVASAFSATSTEQMREMREDLERAFAYRAVLNDQGSSVEDAGAWFDANTWRLQTMFAWSYQRILWLEKQAGLNRAALETELAQNNHAKLARLIESPLFFAQHGRTVQQLEPD